jgi:hypothetical protein
VRPASMSREGDGHSVVHAREVLPVLITCPPVAEAVDSPSHGSKASRCLPPSDRPRGEEAGARRKTATVIRSRVEHRL